MVKLRKIVLIISIISVMIISLSTISNAAESAKAFGNSNSSYSGDSTGYAIYGFNELGYSVTGTSGAITKADMLSWIGNTGNGYGFYVHTYGGTGYFNDYYGYSINSSMVSGNWHLVYIDSSYSAADSSLASAFNTIGYSGRCFLGWSNAVTLANANLFNYYFWVNYVGTSTIQSAAINAASNVPGSGTTPITLYGSTSYYGYAQ